MRNFFNISLVLIICLAFLQCETELENPEIKINTDTILKTSKKIDNNSIWEDTNGDEIKAQGGCIIQDGNIFHWIGPHFEAENKNFLGINHYTSSDLTTWTKEAPILTPGSSGMSNIPIYSTTWVGRPWIFKRNSADWVMWLELGKLSGSQYRNRYAVFAASDISGPWTFIRQYESLPDLSGTQRAMGDLGGYQDGTDAYILYTYDKTEANECQHIVKLSSDFRSVSNIVAEFEKSGYYCKEAAAVFKNGSTYYYFMSETRGWRPSKTWYRTSNSMGATWSGLKEVNMGPIADAYSFRTQHDFVLPVTGTNATTYIYCGDRWSLYGTTDYNNVIGRQAWFPLTFDTNGNPTIEAPNFSDDGGDWYIDVTAGIWGTTSSSNINLIVNGDFSDDYSNWHVSGIGSITTATDEVHSASKASNSYSRDAFKTTLSNSSAKNCSAGIYTAKVWSRSKEVSYTWRKFEIYVNDVKTNELTLSTSTDWTEYIIEGINVPEGATVKVQIYINVPTGSWTQFDDFSLVKN